MCCCCIVAQFVEVISGRSSSAAALYNSRVREEFERRRIHIDWRFLSRIHGKKYLMKNY